MENALFSKYLPPAKLSKDLAKLLNLNKTAHIRSKHTHAYRTYLFIDNRDMCNFVCVLLLFIPLGRD